MVGLRAGRATVQRHRGSYGVSTQFLIPITNASALNDEVHELIDATSITNEDILRKLKRTVNQSSAMLGLRYSI